MCKMRDDTFGLRVEDEAVRQAREMSAEGKKSRACGRTGARNLTQADGPRECPSPLLAPSLPFSCTFHSILGHSQGVDPRRA